MGLGHGAWDKGLRAKSEGRRVSYWLTDGPIVIPFCGDRIYKRNLHILEIVDTGKKSVLQPV